MDTQYKKMDVLDDYTCSVCGKEVSTMKLKGLSLICPYCESIL